MGAWDAGEQECGEFVGLKDGYTMETTNEGALLTVEGDFAERDGALEFAFDKKGNIESLTIGAHYSTAEILKKQDLIRFSEWERFCCIDLYFIYYFTV